MRALLLVDHGSRQPAANRVVEEVVRRIRARRPGLVVEHAHMEIAQPSLADAVAKLAAAGVLEIVVHPYFLAPGLHTSETIPMLVTAVANNYPQVRIRISEPLGVHDQLVEVVLERSDATFFE
jgi:sirohydrochlorin ferrochelatase